jgi:hypothetical protein
MAVVLWSQRWSGQGQQLAGLTPEVQLISDAIASSFRRVERGRSLAYRRTLIRTPWGVNAGGT